MTITPKSDQTRRDMIWAGLIDDPKTLEEERQRRAAPAPARTPKRRLARPERRWIPIGRDPA